MIPDSLENISTSAFIGLDEQLNLGQRSNLIELDRQLHELWNLGKNFILGWCPTTDGIELLVVQHYAIADYTIESADRPTPTDDTHAFIMRMLTGSRRLSARHLTHAVRLFDCETQCIKLRQPLLDDEAEAQIIDRLVQRYSVSYVPNRAVALFEQADAAEAIAFETALVATAIAVGQGTLAMEHAFVEVAQIVLTPRALPFAAAFEHAVLELTLG